MSSARSSPGDPWRGSDLHAPLGEQQETSGEDTGDLCCRSCGQPVGFWATDRLTGLLDRWGWDTKAPELLQDARRSGHPTALLLVDLDRFKDINDTFGHIAGDQLLQTVASVLRDCTREGDLVGRYGGHGGDEFLVMLPRTSLGRALAVAGRVQSGINALVVDASVDAGTTTVLQDMTASIGVSVLHPDEDADLTLLVMDADTALREAKRAGRDRVEACTSRNRAAAVRGQRRQPRGIGSEPGARATRAGHGKRSHAPTLLSVRRRTGGSQHLRKEPMPVETRAIVFALSGLIAGTCAMLGVALNAAVNHTRDAASQVPTVTPPPAPTTLSPTPAPPSPPPAPSPRTLVYTTYLVRPDPKPPPAPPSPTSNGSLYGGPMACDIMAAMRARGMPVPNCRQ